MVVSILTGLDGAPNDVAKTDSIRVLVADDQNLFRDGIANILSTQTGIEVAACADTAPAAVEAIRNLRPDVALVGWPASSVNSHKVFAAIQEFKLQTRVILLVWVTTRKRISWTP